MVLWNQQQPARQGLTLRANVNQPSGQQEANSSNSGFVYQPPVQKYLNDCRSFYSCIYCRTHLANHDELVSRSFQGNRSRAYLFNSVINVSCGPAVRRELNTGSHAVADVFCINCGTTIGWKYERAYVDSQRYKEGKYIIELAHVVRENRHLELDRRDKFLGLVSTSPQQQQQQPQPQHGAATIGTANGRGSLSPDSGQWSPGSSSSSSPSSASSNAETLEAPRRSPSCRYFDEQDASERQKKKNNNNSNNNDDDDEPNDEDEEEILMFPFYDELYRNRSSCSNLSTSRSYQRRLRRSLYLEASPYDWKYARSRTVSSSSAAASGVASSPNDQLLQQPSIFSASSDSIEIPLSVAQNQGQVNGQTTEHQHEQQHETDNSKRQQLLVEYLASQLRALRSSSASGMDSEHEQLSSETSKRANRPSLSATSRRKADDGETQFEFEHDSQPSVDESVNDDEDDDEDEDEDDDEREKKSRPNDTKQQGLDCDRRPVASTSGEGANQQAKSSKAGPSSSASSSSLSLEEEEFYDCCTDHEVANYSAVGRK